MVGRRLPDAHAGASRALSDASPEHHRIAVIGTGFSGIGLAVRLREAGIHDFVLLERADDLGGTWRDNTYPGCRCDVPSRLYSFSFAPNPDWSQAYSGQQEIWDYLRRVAEDHGVTRAHPLRPRGDRCALGRRALADRDGRRGR